MILHVFKAFAAHKFGLVSSVKDFSLIYGPSFRNFKYCQNRKISSNLVGASDKMKYGESA